MSEGLQDFTGLIISRTDIRKNQGGQVLDKFSDEYCSNGQLDPAKKMALWQRILDSIKSGKTMMGCAISSSFWNAIAYQGMQEQLHHDGTAYFKKNNNYKFTGLVTGHAYSVCDALTLNYQGKEQKLVRVRNPWGQANKSEKIERIVGAALGEWLGSWSDFSAELIASKREINKKLQELRGKNAELIPESKDDNDDGAFFMEYEDFFSNWTDMEFVTKFDDKYSGVRFLSNWN